ncbi:MULTISPECIES: hypothetical protein [Halomonadaceae]|jgi:hypothetical protein|uniref:DUF7673 domain-containing protein n=2 Tax=Halomonadaceae TaxID=28256 RepID=A0A2A4HHL9_9GAMM|nr:MULTISPECIES: hypothetical protein [Halomonas]PCF93685.1 hypothetical protein CPA45_20935 [Halomonas nigrificans]QJQ97751.1 hypothetical protein HIR79_02945 [Halomonas sp. PGE1]WLI71939.1 hypothetical protein B6N23_08840 [Halomonas alkalicola]
MSQYRVRTPEPRSRLSQALAQVMNETRQRQLEAEQQGLSSLEHLICVAQGHSGQSHHLRRLLLALYNGDSWPFEMQRLRGLDPALQADALAVIQMATYSGHEIHTFIEGGDALLKRFWEIEEAKDE